MNTIFYKHSAEFFWLPAVSSYRCSRAFENKTHADVLRIELKFGWMKLQIEFIVASK